jgi:lipopolysaccharide export system protein LptC
MRPWSDSHTQIVTMLKLFLPLVALAILSSLFIFSRVIDPEAAIPYATVDVADRLREPKVTEAQYAGMTDDGSAIAITVAVAVPNGTTGGSAKQVTARITSKQGDLTEVLAAALAYGGNTAALTGGVDVRNSGFELKTEAMDLVMDEISLTSRGTVTGTGPLGSLTAGKMRLSASKAAAGDYLLVFNSGVHLIYQPLK